MVAIIMKYQQAALRILWVTICLPLLVVFLPQAIYVKKTTLRLPEAKGQPFSQENNENPIQLLHVGESTVAGVGVETLTSGFTSNIASALSNTLSRPTAWSLFGENGIRIKGLNQVLAKEITKLPKAGSYDLAIVTMGVNDSTKFTTIKQWRTSLAESARIITQVTQGPIYFTQVPPLGQFPALPSPLKNLLGVRSKMLDNELKAFCEQNHNIHYIGSEVQVEREMMAVDGYHPSELGYQQWAGQIAEQIKQTWSS